MASDTPSSSGSQLPPTPSGAPERTPHDRTSRGVDVRSPGARPTELPDAVAGVFADYQERFARPGEALDADTVRVYRSRVRQYLAWLAAALADGTVEGAPLTDPGARDRAARAYRTHLQTVANRKPATINAHLTAIDDLYRRRGLGPAAAERAENPLTVPRALDERDRLRLLREADHAPPRERAIAFTAFYAGTRIGETTALDTTDVHLSARMGFLTVRRRKDGTFRTIPLHPELRAALEAWIHERAGWKGADANPALFLNRRGGRLSSRSAYSVLRAIADAADLLLGQDGIFTPQVLRSTAGITMVKKGTDIVIVAELLGHSVETARRYSRPTRQDHEKAIERLTVEERSDDE